MIILKILRDLIINMKSKKRKFNEKNLQDRKKKSMRILESSK